MALKVSDQDDSLEEDEFDSVPDVMAQKLQQTFAQSRKTDHLLLAMQKFQSLQVLDVPATNNGDFCFDASF